MENNDTMCLMANFIQYGLTATQTNEKLQMVSLILSIASTVFITVCKVWQWVKKAKEDGKIDNKELEELQKIFEDAKENKK